MYMAYDTGEWVDAGEESLVVGEALEGYKRRAVYPFLTTGSLSVGAENNIFADVYKFGYDVTTGENGELDSLSQALDRAFDRLKPGGRLAVITFQSLEDRMVKQRFAALCKGCICPPDFPVCVCGRKPRGKLVWRKPVEASPEELAANSRSKSAKLRAIERCEPLPEQEKEEEQP